MDNIVLFACDAQEIRPAIAGSTPPALSHEWSPSEAVLAQVMIGDNELVYDSKRMLGATYDDLAAVRFGDKQSDIQRWPFLVQRSRINPTLPVVTGGERLAPCRCAA